MKKTLYRNKENAMVGGVCSGLADYFDIDVTLTRLIGLFSVFLGGSGLVAYIIMWVIMPKRPQDGEERVPYEDGDDFESGEYSQAGGEFEIYGRPHRREDKEKKPILGFALIALGSFFLVDKFFPFDLFEYFWPVIIIGVGFALIAKKKG